MSRYLPILIVVSASAGVAIATETSLVDSSGDAVVRRTDPGADGLINAVSVLPDLLAVNIDRWEPTDPLADPYSGTPGPGDELVRIQIEFDGLVCPPGPLGLGGQQFDPFRFGDSPVYGYLDIDADDRKDTGGELGGAALNRYLANVARFGARPKGSFGDQAATVGDQLDSDFFTAPFFERTGADFAVVMCGCFSPILIGGDTDLDGVFDPGETWIVEGRFFERAQGYQDASAAFGGSDDGLYDPVVALQFAHDDVLDRTTVTLVYPLTMHGAAVLSGQPEQPRDFDVANHTSIEEAIEDIIGGAAGLQEPTRTLTEDWQGRDPEDATDVGDWRVTALFGTSYAQPEPSLFVWTDTGFDATAGDLDGDGSSGASDEQLFDAELTALDGGPSDADGTVNGVVVIPGFGTNFHLNDLDGNGLIEQGDRDLIVVCVADVTTQNAPVGDPDHGEPDGLVTVADLQFFVNAWIALDPIADVTSQNSPVGDPAYGVPDGSVTVADLQFFVNAWIAGCPS